MSHTCKALLVCCMDFRFQPSLIKFAEEQGLTGSYDLFSIAGTQKNFITPETQAIALRQVELSQALHGATDIYLIAHWDCGAYGGNATLGGGEAELQKYSEDLEAAKVVITEKYPNLTVHKYLAKLEADGSINYNKI